MTSLQPPYSAIRREVESDILPYAKEHNIGVIVYSPMQSGLLTGKMTRERIAQMPAADWRKSDAEFQEPKLSKNPELAELMSEIGVRRGVSAGVVAVAWTLRNEAVTGAIVGARNPQHKSTELSTRVILSYPTKKRRKSRRNYKKGNYGKKKIRQN